MFPRITQRLIRLVFLVLLVFCLALFGLNYVKGANSEVSSIHKATNRYATGFYKNTEFEKQIRKRFSKVQENKNDRYWLGHTGLTETTRPIKIKNFLKNRNDKQFEDDNSWLNKNEMFYDPRFTLSVYLNAIKHKYSQVAMMNNADAEALPRINDLGRIELPFNWIDWLDLTVLNGDLSKPLQNRMNCHYIRQGTNNDPDPGYFCFDNNHFSDEEVIKMGFKDRNQLPGFVIHAHSSHDDRPFNDLRILEAKNYALTQHLPKPLQVIILNQDGGTFEFNVKNPENQRMITSDLIHYYIDTNLINKDEINDDFEIPFDPVKEFTDLKQKLIPRHLTPQEDVSKMYKTLKEADPRATRELHLSSDMFHYGRNMINEQLNQYEPKDLNTLTANERMYVESLRFCSTFEKESDEETYFKMATIRIDDSRNRDKEWGWHYDWRFFNGALNYDRIDWNTKELNYRSNIILDRLLRNWSRFAEEKGLISWIMHGPLLSWYWDGLMFPFDLDIDIQMPMSELIRLAKDFNQTLIVEDPSEGYGKYFIDVGTFIHNREVSSKSNHIDARVVDVDSGIYIDITALARSSSNTPEEYQNNHLVDIVKPENDDQAEIYNDRRKHFYKLNQLSPLKYSVLGGVPVYIPSVITNRLIFEYPDGLSNVEFHGWYFISRLNLWVKEEQLAKIYREKDIKNSEGEYDRDKLLKKVHSMSDPDVIRLLDSDDELLIEYYLTKDLTDSHDLEKHFLFDSTGKDSGQLGINPPLRIQYNEFVSAFKMSKPLRKSLWDYENLERMKHHR